MVKYTTKYLVHRQLNQYLLALIKLNTFLPTIFYLDKRFWINDTTHVSKRQQKHKTTH